MMGFMVMGMGRVGIGRVRHGRIDRASKELCQLFSSKLKGLEQDFLMPYRWNHEGPATCKEKY